MQLSRLAIVELVEITPVVHRDSRGYFLESFKDEWFRRNVANVDFLQENQSFSEQEGTIRGLHFQAPPSGQGKLVRCISGAILDVAVDIRKGSTTYGQWASLELTAQNHKQLWIPEGFAHGFCTLQPNSVIFYKTTAPYAPKLDFGVRWNDPQIDIVWPDIADSKTLSQKDRMHPPLEELPAYFEVNREGEH